MWQQTGKWNQGIGSFHSQCICHSNLPVCEFLSKNKTTAMPCPLYSPHLVQWDFSFSQNSRWFWREGGLLVSWYMPNCRIHLTKFQTTTQNVSNRGFTGRLAAWSSNRVTGRGQHWLGSKHHSVSVSVEVVVEVMEAAAAVVLLWWNYFNSGSVLSHFKLIYLFILGLVNCATLNFDHITSNYSVIMTKC
jgi:hypothetical protein